MTLILWALICKFMWFDYIKCVTLILFGLEKMSLRILLLGGNVGERFYKTIPKGKHTSIHFLSTEKLCQDPKVRYPVYKKKHLSGLYRGKLHYKAQTPLEINMFAGPWCCVAISASAIPARKIPAKIENVCIDSEHGPWIIAKHTCGS